MTTIKIRDIDKWIAQNDAGPGGITGRKGNNMDKFTHLDKHTQQMLIAAKHMSALLSDIARAGCVYMIMDEAYLARLRYPELVRDSRGNRLILGNQYMTVICPNGYQYYINVTGDSVLTACDEVFHFISGKL